MAFALLLAVMAALCLLRCYAGFFGVWVYARDAFALLDPAWRVLNGQRPHIDFYSQLGPAPYLWTALGLIFSGKGAEGMFYGQVLVGFATAIWTYIVAGTRIMASFRHILTLYVLLLAIAPYSVGENFAGLTAAMSYNRIAYALAAVVLVEALTPAGFWSGFSTGAALALLLFTKITFFAGAVFLVAALAFGFVRSKRGWLGVALGFCLPAAAFCAYLQFQFPAILRDYRISAAAKHIGATKLLGAALNLFFGESLSLAAFLFLFCLAYGWKDWRRWTAAGCAVLLAGSFILFGNAQAQGLPLNACLALVLAGTCRIPDRLIRSGLIAGALLMAAGPIATGVSSILFADFERAARHIPPLRTPGLSTFRIRDHAYADFVDDGVELASKFRRPGDTILSLDFSDFFSYALRIPPPKGGAACLQFESTFNDRGHPAPERLLGSASIVMEPVKFSEEGSQLAIPRIYGPYLNAHFRLEAESAQWRLYRRKTD